MVKRVLSSISKNSYLGVILRGGKSTRMGEDKSSIVFNGHSLYYHMKQILLNAGVKTIYISGGHPEFNSIPDFKTNMGPIGGIFSIMMQEQFSKFDYILFVPIDMPLLQTTNLQGLFDNIHKNDAVCYKNIYLPLLLRNSNKLCTHLKKYLSDTNRTYSIHYILSTINTKFLAIKANDHMQFANLNTRDDLEYAEKYIQLVEV